MPGVRTQLQNGPRGRSKVSLLLLLEDGTEVEVALPGGYTVSPDLVDAIKHSPASSMPAISPKAVALRHEPGRSLAKQGAERPARRRRSPLAKSGTYG